MWHFGPAHSVAAFQRKSSGICSVGITDRYVVCPYPGRITLIRPTDAPFAVPSPPDRGWGRWASDVEVHLVPGQHHSMVKEPHVRELARTLDDCLRRAEADG